MKVRSLGPDGRTAPRRAAADRAFTWEEGLTELALGAAMSNEGSHLKVYILQASRLG